MLAFSHPTTVLVVDDDPLFLDSFRFHFGRGFRCVTCRSPHEAIQRLRASYKHWRGNLDVGPIGGDWAEPGPGLSRPFGRLAHEPTRTDVISVAIIDFAMPGMSGVELCRDIIDLPVSKLLLTGKVGNETAVAAFNEGLIDRFMVKQDPHIVDVVNRLVATSQRAFFEKASLALAPVIQGVTSSYVMTQDVRAAVEKKFEDLGVVEHYLCHNPPGFLVTERAGNRKHLILCDAETMRAHREVADEMGAPEGLKRVLLGQEHVAWFPELGYYSPDYVDCWERFIVPATRVGASGLLMGVLDEAVFKDGPSVGAQAPV